MKTLKDLKVGDAVWTIQTGIDFVKSIEELIILEGGESYYPNGCYRLKDMYPSLFLENIFEKKIEPKLMLCKFIGWTEENVIVASNGDIFVKSGYTEAKEIEPETLPKMDVVAEISLQEIAEKFGVDVEQIRIKS
jgi:LysM repeat protein